MPYPSPNVCIDGCYSSNSTVTSIIAWFVPSLFYDVITGIYNVKFAIRRGGRGGFSNGDTFLMAIDCRMQRNSYWY
jgi:hypothetical protein